MRKIIYILLTVLFLISSHSVSKAGDGEGRARILPASNVVVDTKFSRTLIYKVGPSGIKQEGKIVFEFYKAGLYKSGKKVNTSLALLEDSIKAFTNNSNVTLDVELRKEKIDAGPCKICVIVTVSNGELKKGDYVGLRFKAHAGVIAHNYYFPIWTDYDGDDNYALIKRPPTLNFIGGSAKVLVISLPANTTPHTSYEMAVVVLDKYGNPAVNYSGTIAFECTTDPEATVDDTPISQKTYTFSPKIDKGVHVFTIKFSRPGIHRVIAYDTTTELKLGSNPTKCESSMPKYKILFGDLHWHTRLSDTNVFISLPEAYQYAKDISRLDFAASNDHSECFEKTGIWLYCEYIDHLDMKVSDWEYTKYVCERFNQPHKFTTLLGYEWSQRGDAGDRNVYYKDDIGAPVFSSIYGSEELFNPNKPQSYWLGKYDSIEELWNHLYETMEAGLIKDALTIPHASMAPCCPGGGTNWDEPKNPDENFQRLVEIYSMHGCSEYYGCKYPEPFHWGNPRPEGSVQYALGNRGYKLGIIANSDNHIGHPGMNNWIESIQQTGGLTAVLAEENTREAIWKALKARRCYATSGVKILLNFTIDGHLMGEEYTTDSNPTIHVDVHGTSYIEKVEIIKNCREEAVENSEENPDEDLEDKDVIFTVTPEEDTMDVSFDYTDEEFTQTTPPGKTSFYYIRVTQKDKEMVWSSPIWVTRK